MNTRTDAGHLFRPALFTLGVPLICTRCARTHPERATDIEVAVTATIDATGEVRIIEVAETGHQCRHCGGKRTVVEKPRDLDGVPEPAKGKQGWTSRRYAISAEPRKAPKPKPSPPSWQPPSESVGCTECIWTGMRRYLIDGDCPACNGNVKPLFTADADSAKRPASRTRSKRSGKP